MRIGIFGGTFDPVHNAHLIIARYACENLELNEILFVPAAIPPHKIRLQISSDVDRWQMLNLAVEKIPCFKVSRIELDRPGVSYTVVTIEQIRQERNLSVSDIFLIIGADSLIAMDTWHQPEQIFENCQVAVYPRPHIDLRDAPPQFFQRAILLNAPLLEISSTMIRQRVSLRLPIHSMVPDGVRYYIQNKKLYQKSDYCSHSKNQDIPKPGIS